MKRGFICVLIALLSCAGSCAYASGRYESDHWQEHRNSLSISGGYVSGFWLAKSIIAWIPAAASHSRNWDYYGNYGLQYYYQLNSWCRMGTKATWEGDQYDIYESNKTDANKKGETTNHTLSLVASVQFTYVNREHVQVYSGLDLGAGVFFTSTKYEPGYSSSSNTSANWDGAFLPAFNVTPLGVAFGSWRVYGYVETNIGYDAFAKIGIGVHL